MQHFQQSALKALKRSKKLLARNKPSFALISIGIIIFIFGAFNYYRVRILSFSIPPTLQGSSLQGSIPIHITIPSIKIDLDIETGEIKDGVWLISYSKATFLNSSSRPGTGGNIVIYGHNKTKIFGNLPYLSLGQKIFIKTSDGAIHVYEAYQKDFVKPDRVDLISPANKEELTIYTCWGLFDSQRAVIKARPI